MPGISRGKLKNKTHTHTYIYIYMLTIYIYICNAWMSCTAQDETTRPGESKLEAAVGLADKRDACRPFHYAFGTSRRWFQAVVLHCPYSRTVLCNLKVKQSTNTPEELRRELQPHMSRLQAAAEAQPNSYGSVGVRTEKASNAPVKPAESSEPTA